MEHPKLLELPTSARIVRAFGQVATESLDDEYQPSRERRAAFVAALQELSESETEQALDDFNVRL